MPKPIIPRPANTSRIAPKPEMSHPRRLVGDAAPLSRAALRVVVYFEGAVMSGTAFEPAAVAGSLPWSPKRFEPSSWTGLVPSFGPVMSGTALLVVLVAGSLPSSPMVLVGAFWLGATASSADAVESAAPIATIATIVRIFFMAGSFVLLATPIIPLWVIAGVGKGR